MLNSVSGYLEASINCHSNLFCILNKNTGVRKQCLRCLQMFYSQEKQITKKWGTNTDVWQSPAQSCDNS